MQNGFTRFVPKTVAIFFVEGSIPTAIFHLENPSKSHREKINNDNFLYTQST